MIKVPLNCLTREEENELHEINKSIQEVIRSGLYIQGLHHGIFEEEFAKFTQAKFAIGVASGTDALILALRSIGVGLGSEVICAANAGGYTSVAAKSIGAIPKYCDVDVETGLITAEMLDKVLTPQTSAVVITHLFGNVAEMNEIVSLCNLHKIPLIEDCAQASGARYSGKHVGNFGDIGVFSFYPTKNLGAIGDGGMLIVNDEVLAKNLYSLRQYGWSSKYVIGMPGGMNSRLDELQAAILRVKLRNLDKKNSQRIEIIRAYQDAFKLLELGMLTSAKPGSVAHLAVILLPKNLDRDEFRNSMNLLGIQTDVHYPLLDTEQIGLKPGRSLDHIPNSRKLIRRIVSIPIFPEMTSSEITAVIEAVRVSVSKNE